MDTELSFEQVVGAYSSTVYSVALTHTANRTDADDVFQEVFVAYWRSKPVLTSEEHRKAWLIRTTLNQALKITQSSWAKKTVYTDGDVKTGDGTVSSFSLINEDTVPSPVFKDNSDELPSCDFPFQSEQQMKLYAVIRSLSTTYRTVVMLFYFEDLSIAQIAAVLDEEQGTVKTRLSRARAQLRVKLAE